METNDLKPKRGLTAEALRQYALVLEAVHRAAPEVKILVTGLMPRKDVGQPLIDHSNWHLEEIVREFNQATGLTSSKQHFFFLPNYAIKVVEWFPLPS
jgi:hypothetical protein